MINILPFLLPSTKPSPAKKQDKNGNKGRPKPKKRRSMFTDQRKSDLKLDVQKPGLPSAWYFSSSHVFINRERQSRGIPPLYRSSELDILARDQAERMAMREGIFHSCKSVGELKQFLRSSHAGENIQRGKNIRKMHVDMMTSSSHRCNVLSDSFSHFGMGTAKGEDGRLYLVQLFRDETKNNDQPARVHLTGRF
jgi:hypothetical protein